MVYCIHRPALSEPVISEPYVSEKIKIDDSCHFLALFTRGFYRVVEEISGRDMVSFKLLPGLSDSLFHYLCPRI